MVSKVLKVPRPSQFELLNYLTGREFNVIRCITKTLLTSTFLVLKMRGSLCCFFKFQIKVCAANVQERLVFKKDFFILIFAAINQERLLFESVHYWRGYGINKRPVRLSGTLAFFN